MTHTLLSDFAGGCSNTVAVSQLGDEITSTGTAPSQTALAAPEYLRPAAVSG